MAATVRASPLAALNTAILGQIMSDLTKVDEICLSLTCHHFYKQVKFYNTPPSSRAAFKLSQLCPRPALFLMKMSRKNVPFQSLMWRLAHWMPRNIIKSLLLNEKAWLRSLPVKRGVHVQVVTSWDQISGARSIQENSRLRIFEDQFGHDITWGPATIALNLLKMGATREELDEMNLCRGWHLPDGW